jgi:DAK2 domain fusion protein YloV
MDTTGKTRYEHTIDGKLLSKMLMGGFTNLSYNIDYLNEINVFPVSDSDTGTNMKKTFESGVAALNDEASFCDVLSAFVKGLLIGSRGNSGFILSQYFSGIYEYTQGKNAISVADLTSALSHAYQVAYRAVLNPVEGTILTIMREGPKRALQKIGDKTSIQEFFDILAGEMFICVRETVNQMNMLHDNNVLDSGAVGLYLIFDGMRSAFHEDLQHFDCEKDTALPSRSKTPIKTFSFFRYCTEFVLTMHKVQSRDYFLRLLIDRGDSIVVAADESLLKVHIHTSEPQKILEEFKKYGDIVTMKIDDLFLTQEFDRLKQRKHTGFTVVAFTCGEGNAVTLENLGADAAFCVPGDHNPSEESLQNLLSEFLKENLIVFASDREMRERLGKIKRSADLQNVYVVESDGLANAFFMLSSLIFTDEFKDVVKSLESFKKQKVFQTSIKTMAVYNHIQYSGNLGDQTITMNDFAELLNMVASEKVLSPYSTVVVFGGKNCKQEDIDSICAHFEKNSGVEFTYLDGQQQECDFIIGAF